MERNKDLRRMNKDDAWVDGAMYQWMQTMYGVKITKPDFDADYYQALKEAITPIKKKKKGK